MTYTPEEFFEYLQTKIENEYANSNLTNGKDIHITPNYAICDTPIQKGKDIIAGLNWGDISKGKQTCYPKADKDRNWRFLKSSEQYFIQYLGINLSKLAHVNYTNLCFFRTKKLSHLTETDWEISLPLFQEYVNYINPPRILILGTSVIDIVKKYCNAENHLSHKVTENKTTAKGYNLEICGIKTYCVPHPQARISSIARDEIWQRVFEEQP